jgi:hypothetical protein
MRSTGIYKKVGRRYQEIGEYDPECMDYFGNGATLVVKHKSVTARYYNVDVAVVPMLAAAKYCEDAVSSAIMRATEIRRSQRGVATPLTPGQKAAWENLVKEFGDDAKQLEWPSAREAAEAAGKALQEETEKLLANESIRQAYDHFMLLCKLSAQHETK